MRDMADVSDPESGVHTQTHMSLMSDVHPDLNRRIATCPK
jgi:hypothetical protein